MLACAAYMILFSVCFLNSCSLLEMDVEYFSFLFVKFIGYYYASLYLCVVNFIDAQPTFLNGLCDTPETWPDTSGGMLPRLIYLINF